MFYSVALPADLFDPTENFRKLKFFVYGPVVSTSAQETIHVPPGAAEEHRVPQLLVYVYEDADVIRSFLQHQDRDAATVLAGFSAARVDLTFDEAEMDTTEEQAPQEEELQEEEQFEPQPGPSSRPDSSTRKRKGDATGGPVQKKDSPFLYAHLEQPRFREIVTIPPATLLGTVIHQCEP